MPKACCVPECHSRGDRSIGVSFFRFPVEPQLRKQWIYMIRRDPGKYFNIGKHTCVCSLHFKEKEMVERSGDCVKKRLLNPGAIPSIFPFNPKEPPSKKIRGTRKKRRPPTPTDPELIRFEDSTYTPQVQDDHDYLATVLTEEEARSRLREVTQQVEELKAEVQMLKSCRFLCIDTMRHNDDYIQHLTGFKSFRKFEACFVLLEPYMSHAIYWSSKQTVQKTTALCRGSDKALGARNEFFLTMIKLKRGWSEKDLAVFFNVSLSTVNSILVNCINLLYFTLGRLLTWPSKEVVAATMPDSFKSTYPNTRVIIDMAEIYVEQSPSVVNDCATSSSCKRHTIRKSLVGISPSQAVTFVSELYDGTISDKELLKRSGLLDLLEPKDEVMVGKSLNISAELGSKGACLTVLPPRNSQVINGDMQETSDIRNVWVCMENIMNRIKCFEIFDRPIPLSLAGCASQLWVVCGLLINFL